MTKLFLISAALALFTFPAGVLDLHAAQAPIDLEIAEGKLSRLDVENQLLWLKAADGNEMYFSYTRNTRVTGTDDAVEGLANLNGSTLRVHFQSLTGTKVAREIEVLPNQGQVPIPIYLPIRLIVN
jgi:hypothetical protein